MTEFSTQMEYAAEHILTEYPAQRIDVIEEVGHRSDAEWLLLSTTEDGSVSEFRALAGDEWAVFDRPMSIETWIVTVEPRPNHSRDSITETVDGLAAGGWEAVRVSDLDGDA